MSALRGDSVVLVTGGAGFIGQNFVHFLTKARNAPHIVVLDALTYAANLSGIQGLIQSGRVAFEKGDIADLGLVRDVFRRRKIDAVVHLAAETHVDRSIEKPDAFIETNINGTHNLLKCVLASWKERGILDRALFLCVSTDEVFGDLGPHDTPFSETSPYRPSSPYSASKAAGDHLARAYFRTYGLPVVVTNCSNNYGPYQNSEKLVPLMITHALSGQSMPVFGDGMNVRDWLFVEDHCRSLFAILERGEIGTTYNVGGGTECTNSAIVARICEIIDTRFASDPAMKSRFPACPAAKGLGCASLVGYVPDRLGHDRRYAIDAGRLRRELGVVPLQTLESGLALTVNWYIDNEAWWREAAPLVRATPAGRS